MRTCAWILDNDEECGEQPEGFTHYCASHNRQMRREQEQIKKQSEKRAAILEKAKAKNKIPRQSLNKVSLKRKEENEEYIILREKFLRVNPECQAGIENICTKESEDVHHMKGRGILLNESKFWLAVCRNCHIYITNHPVDAMKRNLSFSRLSTQKETV